MLSIEVKSPEGCMPQNSASFLDNFVQVRERSKVISTFPSILGWETEKKNLSEQNFG